LAQRNALRSTVGTAKVKKPPANWLSFVAARAFEVDHTTVDQHSEVLQYRAAIFTPKMVCAYKLVGICNLPPTRFRGTVSDQVAPPTPSQKARRIEICDGKAIAHQKFSTEMRLLEANRNQPSIAASVAPPNVAIDCARGVFLLDGTCRTA
jgi:hypothetical protein